MFITTGLKIPRDAAKFLFLGSSKGISGIYEGIVSRKECGCMLTCSLILVWTARKKIKYDFAGEV